MSSFLHGLAHGALTFAVFAIPLGLHFFPRTLLDLTFSGVLVFLFHFAERELSVPETNPAE